LSVDGIKSSCVWDSGDKGRSTGHCRSSTGCQDGSYGNILDQSWVDAGLLDYALTVRKIILWESTCRIPASISSGNESLKPPFPARVIAVLSAETMTT
jgi:hypothetical protein